MNQSFFPPPGFEMCSLEPKASVPPMSKADPLLYLNLFVSRKLKYKTNAQGGSIYFGWKTS